jgi:hypothetical protein
MARHVIPEAEIAVAGQAFPPVTRAATAAAR